MDKTDTYTVDFSLPSDIALGNYHVGVIVDYDNQLSTPTDRTTPRVLRL